MRAALFAVLALCATAGTAAANPPTWMVRGFSAERWQGTKSSVTLATAPITGGGVAVERRVARIAAPFRPIDVTAELAWDAGSTDGTTFQQLANHIGTWELTAGTRARLPVFPWLAVQARAAIGGAHTRVTIDNMAGPSTAISDAGNTMVASTGLGLALISTFHLALEAEVGYQVSTAATIHAYPENRPAEDLTIPSRYASLGDLELDGWTLRIGADIHF